MNMFTSTLEMGKMSENGLKRILISFNCRRENETNGEQTNKQTNKWQPNKQMATK
jgi:hypothetical protein